MTDKIQQLCVRFHLIIPLSDGNVTLNVKASVDSIQGKTGDVTLYTAGTEDLIVGTSSLANGSLYFVYEGTSATSLSDDDVSQASAGEATNFVSSVNGFAGVVNLFTVSEEDIVAGATGLETGKLYFVYE